MTRTRIAKTYDSYTHSPRPGSPHTIITVGTFVRTGPRLANDSLLRTGHVRTDTPQAHDVETDV